MTFLTYDSALSRVRIDLATVRGLLSADTTGAVERSLDQITWATVRGGSSVSLTSSALPLDDYEFTTDAVNYYRVIPAVGSEQDDSLTPSIGGQVWLKHLRFPFLNMQVSLSDAGDVTRPAQAGIFNVIGRGLPVVVTAARASAQFSVTVATETLDELAALNALLATGDILLLQVPPGFEAASGGYVSAGDSTETRQGVPWARRWVTIPLTQCAAPADDVVGTTVIWQTVIDTYATWSDLVSAQATWQDVLTLVGSPADVTVP